MRKLFITGIGTDTGKTIAAAVLAESLQADYWKPVQCGTTPETDSQTVKRLISNPVSRVHPEAYCLKEAASPHAASEKEGVKIDLAQIGIPVCTNSTLIIEGAGGLLVPLNEKDLVADLISFLGAEVILVASFYLGSINHSLLTCAELKRRNIPVLGLLFTGASNPESERIILKLSGLKKLGSIGHEALFNREAVLRYAPQFRQIL
jgi:dethiobiotin synthetase